MRVCIAVTVLLASAVATRVNIGGRRVDRLPELMPFEEWAAVFRANGTSRSYSTSDQMLNRRAVYQQNLRAIQVHNQHADLGIHSFRQGVNQFTDLSTPEFKDRVSSSYVPRQRSHLSVFDTSSVTPPEALDWRTKGAVTPVKVHIQLLMHD